MPSYDPITNSTGSEKSSMKKQLSSSKLKTARKIPDKAKQTQQASNEEETQRHLEKEKQL